MDKPHKPKATHRPWLGKRRKLTRNGLAAVLFALRATRVAARACAGPEGSRVLSNAVERSRLPAQAQAMEEERLCRRQKSASAMPSRVGAGKRDSFAATCVVIINYNAGDALLRSVAAVLAADEPLRLIVADNASTDGSGEKLRQRYAGQDRVELRQNARNLGFARAVNACALAVAEPFLLILNPDCELATGALAELRRALQQDPQAALAAPRVVDSHGRVLRGTWRSFPEPWKALMTVSGLWRLSSWLPRLRGVESAAGELPHDTCRAEAVSGACMLVRTATFRQLGGFDEAFGLHFEDLDLMYRLRRQHHHCLYVPSASAIHHPGTSSRSRPGWVHRQKHLGMQRFFHKHYADHCSRLGRCAMIAGIWLHYILTLPMVWLRS